MSDTYISTLVPFRAEFLGIFNTNLSASTMANAENMAAEIRPFNIDDTVGVSFSKRIKQQNAHVGNESGSNK